MAQPVPVVDLNERYIYLNDSTRNSACKFHTNFVSTAKYTWWKFLPKFLFEQFSRYANLFFLFTAAIQQIPGVSPTSRFTIIIPLSIVMLASGFKEALEDVRRHKSDREVNHRHVQRLDNQHFQPTLWKDVTVGDLVRVNNGEYFPADLVILSSSEPDGLCYIETANLDGETNLKVRQGIPETFSMLTPQNLSHLEGMIKCEQPNDSLYTFEGTMRLRDKEVPLGPTQLLLRGAMLRNTPWIYGVVVFTGHDTKLMRNTHRPPLKTTSMEKLVNRQIIFLFVILVAMALFCSIANVIWWSAWRNTFYLEGIQGSGAASFFFNFLTFIILFNNLIPISLYVTMELVKFQQAIFVNSDVEMYYDAHGTRATARTSNLVEELGRVQYLFSDKTGTLTQNKMEFRSCSIAGTIFGSVHGEDNQIEEFPDYFVLHDESSATRPLTLSDELATPMEKPSFSDHTLLDMMKQVKDEHSENGPFIHEFLIILAVCHTVIPERSESGELRYQASSPDENALVKAARNLGYVFHTRKPRSITVSVLNEQMTFEILNVLEFNSDRKRMSVIVRLPDGKIKLYCKGADSVIMERLSAKQLFTKSTCEHLETFALEGLRTLCIAFKEIEPEKYAQWNDIYTQASTTIVNRQQEINNAAELIEKDLFLLGATAIEDRLQDGVPETIATLMEAGIKMWVLTGDRQETAVNIGYSCRLLTEDMALIMCNEASHFETKEFLENKLLSLQGYGRHHPSPQLFSTSFPQQQHLEEDDELALIIDGKSLDYALENDIKFTFLEIAKKCKAVICCRVSPLQKALVVKLVRDNLKTITLAIGDGANDVSMIQAAHVGVGISGEEGMQAARSADYAIGQFRFLQKLLLVHGSWAYRRLAKLIGFCFYKNIVLYSMEFWFAFYNGFSGQTLFEQWTIAFWNVCFTVMPPIALGFFDKYVSQRMLLGHPALYKAGQEREFFNKKVFWGWTANAFFHSIVLFALGMIMFDQFNVTGGYDPGLWFIGTTIFTATMVTVILKGALITDTWPVWTHIAIWGSILIWFVFLTIYSALYLFTGIGRELSGIAWEMYATPAFWMAVVIFPVICLYRDYLWKVLKRVFFPRPYHVFQEMEKLGIPDTLQNKNKFTKAIRKVRAMQRMKRTRGYAFSQTEGQADLIRKYDTTFTKPSGY